MPPTTMKHLVTLRDGFEAKVLAARLGSEGVLVELRGSVDGMYPVGLVHVYVEECGLETARTLLALADDEAGPAARDDVEDGGDHGEDGALARRRHERRKLLAVVAVGLVAALVLLELVRHAGGAPQRGQAPGSAGVSASPAEMAG